MGPIDDDAAATPEDVDWAPSPDIIRLLARQTAAVMLPPSPLPVLPGTSPTESRPSVRSPSPDARSTSRRAGNDNKLGDRSDAAMEMTMQSTNDGPSFNRALSPDSIFMNEASESVFSEAWSPSRTAAREYQVISEGSLNDPLSPQIHDVPWNTSIFRPNEKGLYLTATPKVCSCSRVFEPGNNRCVKCGTRRPVQEPDKVPEQVKAMRWMDPDHANAHERCYAWAAVYDQKKYQLLLAKHDEEEAFIEKNGHFTPQLNERSVAMAENKNMTPIHERTELVLLKRQEYLEMRRQQIYDAEVCKECTFCPRLHPKSVGMHGRDRRSLFRWDVKRAQKVNKKLQHQQEAEADSCPFSPALTHTSRRIAEEYSASKNVHNRLAEDALRRQEEFNQEQEIIKNLKPASFASVASPKVATPKSARDKRPMSAPGARSSQRHRSLSPRNGQAGKTRGEASPRSRKDTARASMAVLNMATINTLSERKSNGTPRAKKGFAYEESGATKGGNWDSRKSKSYSLSTEKPPCAPPKSGITSGKNVVKYHPDHTEVLDVVRGIFD